MKYLYYSIFMEFSRLELLLYTTLSLSFSRRYALLVLCRNCMRVYVLKLKLLCIALWFLLFALIQFKDHSAESNSMEIFFLTCFANITKWEHIFFSIDRFGICTCLVVDIVDTIPFVFIVHSIFVVVETKKKSSKLERQKFKFCSKKR